MPDDLIPDLFSPAKAFAEQARWEARVEAVLLSQMNKFLGVVLAETLVSRRYVSGAFYSDAWVAHMGAVALSRRLPPQVAEWVAVTLADSPTPAEAWSSAMAVLTRSAEQAWTASDEEAALRAALSISSGETFLTAGAPVVKKDENGRPIYRRTAAMDEGGMNWYARMQQEARTSVTGLWGNLATEQMKQAGLPEKRWVTRHDERVRDTHVAADGQSVPINEPFIVDGFAMMYPGDRNAPYYLTVNCRCVTVASELDAELAALHPDFAAMLNDPAALEAWMGKVGTMDVTPKFESITKNSLGDTTVQGKFYDADGNFMGRFSRTIEHSEKTVFHNELWLHEDARRQGIATEFNAAMEDLYRGLGIENIRVDAGLEDGGYVWAKAGFDWFVDDDNYGIIGFDDNLLAAQGSYGDPDVTAYLRALDKSNQKVDQAVLNYQNGKGTVEDIQAAYDAMPKPWDIANVSFPAAPNLGSELLRGTEWKGIKPL